MASNSFSSNSHTHDHFSWAYFDSVSPSSLTVSCRWHFFAVPILFFFLFNFPSFVFDYSQTGSFVSTRFPKLDVWGRRTYVLLLSKIGKKRLFHHASSNPKKGHNNVNCMNFNKLDVGVASSSPQPACGKSELTWRNSHHVGNPTLFVAIWLNVCGSQKQHV